MYPVFISICVYYTIVTIAGRENFSWPTESKIKLVVKGSSVV